MTIKVSAFLPMRSLKIITVASLLSAALGQTQRIDPTHSSITVYVFKSGLFGGFADNHEIRAPILNGTFDESAHRVEILIDSRKLEVLDPSLSQEKRRQVEERMLGPEVLDSGRFHEIRFEASNVKQEAVDRFSLTGTLSLHGQTQPISVHLVRVNGYYRGEAVLKQHDFGITPISIAGGTVKVKDELKIKFEIVAESPNNSGQKLP